MINLRFGSRDLIIKDIISEEYIHKINNYFTTDIAVKYFGNYIWKTSDLDMEVFWYA